MAVEGTKFQINYKLHDGTLINLYAASASELEAGLADIAMNALNIYTTGKELNGKLTEPTAVVAAPTVESVAQQFNAPAQPVVVEGQAPTCKHGTMAFRNGTSARGPWKAWMCAAPKGAADKCEAIFLR